MRHSHAHVITVLSVAALQGLLAMGCSVSGSADSIASDNADTAQQSLASYGSGTWTRWGNNVQVCFTRDADVTNDAYTRVKREIMSALAQTWAAHSALTFTETATCGASTLKLNITSAEDWGDCGAGLGTTCGHIPSGGAVTGSVRTQVAIHEIGHGLGLAHEHQRASADGTTWEEPLCAYEQWREENNLPGQRTPDASFTKITAFDPLSIMNYCAGPNGRASTDYLLTALDELGIEMLYPRSLAPAIVGSNCFGTLCREGANSFTTDWYARGARSSYLIGTSWRFPNSQAPAGQIVSATLSSGANSVSVSFKDPFGRSYASTRTITGNNAAHTAILMAAM